jgi:hypothetical protein
MPRRRFITDEAVEAEMLPKIVEAIYPVLIPMEQQDMRIQQENHKHVTECARAAWRKFVDR